MAQRMWSTVYFGDCENCGRTFCYRRARRGRFCSPVCARRARDRRRPPRRRGVNRGSVRPVCVCGRNPIRRNPANAPTHASCDCGRVVVVCPGRVVCDSVVRVSRPKRVGYPPAHCGFCGTSIDYGRKWCSDRCYNFASGRAATASAIGYGDCAQCGALFVRRAMQLGAFCSHTCMRRAHKRKRRRKLRGGETIGLWELGERDGWRCHLCGKPVPQREYKARPLDPTIDHLVPVSAGGENTWENVALAHNRCNWQRADQGAAQLRLIA